MHGRGVGHLALAAVNISVPFITTLVAVSVLFGMGASTVISIRLGRGDQKGANDAFMAGLTLTFILSLVLLAIGMLLSNVLSIFVRNDGAPGVSFGGMCAGAAANIFLDWLFIFPLQMGIMGAAIASGLGQILSLAILLSHFVRKKGRLRIQKYRLNADLVSKICKRGVPECFSQLNTPVTALCYNWVLSHILGDMGVATFSILSFIYSLANAILAGVSQGLQPLWGLAFGGSDRDGLKFYLRAGLKINLVCAVIIYGILCILRIPAVSLFNHDPVLVEMASSALPVFALSFLFMAVNLIFTAYFYSTKQTGKANMIAVSRGIIMKALAIFLTPVLLGNSHIWLAVSVAEGITMVICLIL